MCCIQTSCSIVTASAMMSRTLSGVGRWTSLVKRRQAKSQWRPSSLLMSSFEKVNPGIRPLIGERSKCIKCVVCVCLFVSIRPVYSSQRNLCCPYTDIITCHTPSLSYSPLLQPEDGCKGSGEKDALHSCKCNHSLSKTRRP